MAEESTNTTTVDADSAQDAPKPRRRRRTKAEIEADRAREAAEAAARAAAGEEPTPKHRPGRPRKVAAEAAAAEAAASVDEKPAQEKRPARTRKAAQDEKPEQTAAEGIVASGAAPAQVVASDGAATPKRRPGRPRKTAVATAAADAPGAADSPVATAPSVSPAGDGAPVGAQPSDGAVAAEKTPRRRPGRPRKAAVQEATQDAATAQGTVPAQDAMPAQGATSANDSASAQEAAPRQQATVVPEAPRDVATHASNQAVEQVTRMTQEAIVSAAPTGLPAATLAEADHAAAGDAQDGAEDAQQGSRRRRHNRNQGSQGQGNGGQTQGNGSQAQNQGGQGNGAQSNGFQSQSQGNGFQNRRQNGNQGQNNNQNNNQNRRRNRRQEVAEPSLSRDELAEMKVAELRAKAAEVGVEYVGVHKQDLIEAIYLAAARAEGFRPVAGVLEIGNEGYGWVRTGNYMEGDEDAFVHQSLIKGFGLRPGDRIEGTVAPSRTGNKYPPLSRISAVNGRDPELARNRPRFRDLTPIFPNERLVMEHGKDSTTGRAIDLVAPIGKGQRGLIVSPPKAGKTTVLKKICQSIAANNPEVHLVCLLVDERPEEVTDMQRSIRGEVVASTFDMPAENHTHVAELVIEHAKRLVEQGEDVVVVLDSITRLARAYNLAAPASGRILSGGVDSAALYPPKKFLGAARNIEGGGSLTILASALVDTGSKMDEVIFEEFKGTGNMELKLDRDLADRRIYPAIDPVSSGTRNEDLLISAELQPFIWGVRRILANMNNTERAATALVKGLKATNTNEEFLIRTAKKAQQSEYAGL